MAGFEVMHFAVIISGYGIVLELIKKTSAELKGPELFWLPITYNFT